MGRRLGEGSLRRTKTRRGIILKYILRKLVVKMITGWTGSGLCPIPGFSITDVTLSGYITR